MKKLFTILFVMASAHVFAQSRPVSQEKAVPFTIRGNEQQALAVTPANGTTVPAGARMQFAWKPTTSDQVVYKIKIVEIKGDQSPEQALRSNKPHFEKDSLRDALYQYPSIAPAFASGVSYVWNVQALNRDGKPVGANGTSGLFKVAAASKVK